MQHVELKSFGLPWEVCKTVDGPELGSPSIDEVNLRIDAAPINPAEILIMEGKYASKPPLPARLGIEGVGTITAIGDGVRGFAVGDRVMSMGRANWGQEIQVPASTLIKVSPDADLLQIAMLKVNPATAKFMLDRYVDLKPGDWVVQNAANSAVGRYLIQLAKAKGVHTLNIVRREGLEKELSEMGADLVMVEGEDLPEKVRAELGDANIPLAIDAVAGKATLTLGGILSEEGTVVNYGLLSGEPCQLTADMVVFKGVTLTGFWLAKTLGGMTADAKQQLYGELGELVVSGQISTPVEATYNLDQLAEALRHAYQGGRSGKVLLLPNG
ncbi:MAG: hypothetical protein RL242_2649 [Pseudomonadota bacterium]